VQWDASEYAYLKGRGDKFYLIHMIDDVTSELTARFLLYRQSEPVPYCAKKRQDQKELPRHGWEPLPPTQVGHALRELGIVLNI
jgi:hypothetical protein